MAFKSFHGLSAPCRVSQSQLRSLHNALPRNRKPDDGEAEDPAKEPTWEVAEIDPDPDPYLISGGAGSLWNVIMSGKASKAASKLA